MAISGPLPSRLRISAAPRGSKIAILSPASYPQPGLLSAGVDALTELGFHPVVAPGALRKAHGYFAGSAQERLADLHDAFLDASIRAIFCTRGGYGSNYLLDGIDLEVVAANPKPLLGYSDLTCLQTWLLDRIGLTAFHAPMVAADFARQDGVDTASLLAALEGDVWSLDEGSGLRALRPGKAAGTLYGGCITLLAASLGSEFAAHTEGKLLFLEDLALKPYQFDRLLRQMLLAGKFEGVTGIVFGEMLHCIPEGQPPGTLDEIILRVLEPFDGPIAIGLRSGHVSRSNVTLAFGVSAELDLEPGPVLAFTERGTTGSEP